MTAPAPNLYDRLLGALKLLIRGELAELAFNATYEYTVVTITPVDTPMGQMSFHTERRGDGPDYHGAWDGAAKTGPERICRWCEMLLISADAPAEEESASG